MFLNMLLKTKLSLFVKGQVGVGFYPKKYKQRLTPDVSHNGVSKCFSTFLLQRDLGQMFALLTEPDAMIQVFILLQRHRTVVANFVRGNFGLFRRNPWQTRGET